MNRILVAPYFEVKIGARVPDVRPGEQTIKYMGELQAGSRFFGGILLGVVAVSCTLLDTYMKAGSGALATSFNSQLTNFSFLRQVRARMTAASVICGKRYPRQALSA